MECETCAYYEYDEEYDEYFCSVDMDEDDYARIMQGHYRQCPFWRDGGCGLGCAGSCPPSLPAGPCR